MNCSSVQSIRELSNISNEVKVDAHFRVNVHTEEELEKFMDDFAKCSGTSWNKKNQMDRMGKKNKLSGVRKCIHNVINNKTGSGSKKNTDCKTGKLREPGKHTNCPADLTFKISEPCDSICSDKINTTHALKRKYPLEIDLHYNHNHAIAAADALRYRPVSEETKQLFTDLFDEDVSPSSAYRRVLDKKDEGDETADRFCVPDYKWVFNFHAQYIKKKFGTLNGVDVYPKLLENITKYNQDRGEELAKAKQTATGETIIAICHKFNRRVHEHSPSAGDILIMDATANLDRNDSKIFHLMCPSPLGGLPLGTLITTRANESTLNEALALYKTLLPENAFYGRGKDLGPKLAITDDDAAERNSLNTTWPRTVLLLCIFPHLQVR